MSVIKQEQKEEIIEEQKINEEVLEDQKTTEAETKETIGKKSFFASLKEKTVEGFKNAKTGAENKWNDLMLPGKISKAFEDKGKRFKNLKTGKAFFAIVNDDDSITFRETDQLKNGTLICNLEIEKDYKIDIQPAVIEVPVTVKEEIHKVLCKKALLTKIE